MRKENTLFNMRPIITTRRIIVAAGTHFMRNVWLSLTTVFVLILALLSVNILVGVNALLDRAVTLLENKVDVSVYFDPKTPDGVLEQARFYMASLPQVSSATLLTADKALADFRTLHANDPKILASLSELDVNPLGATVVINARHTTDYPFLLEALKNPQFADFVQSKNYQDHAEAINRVRDISHSVRVFGTVLIAIFALFSVLIVYNTIRIAIYTQREEIGIMRLVGASGAYVRLPFVLEGIFLAVLALIFVGVIVVAAAIYIDPRLLVLYDGESPALLEYFRMNASSLLFTEGGALTVLVAVSSWAAVGSYLKR